jgi:hypothetical protein
MVLTEPPQAATSDHILPTCNVEPPARDAWVPSPRPIWPLHISGWAAHLGPLPSGTEIEREVG